MFGVRLTLTGCLRSGGGAACSDSGGKSEDAAHSSDGVGPACFCLARACGHSSGAMCGVPPEPDPHRLLPGVTLAAAGC